MTVLPESPVREYAKRVIEALSTRRDESKPDSPEADGFCTGLTVAISTVADLTLGTETTYFEYRVVAADGSFKREVWCDDLAETEGELNALRSAFADCQYLIERRTVAVTQPVRLDDDGEPIA